MGGWGFLILYYFIWLVIGIEIVNWEYGIDKVKCKWKWKELLVM